MDTPYWRRLRPQLVNAVVVAAFVVGGAWSWRQGWPGALLSAAQLLPLFARHRAPGVVLAMTTAATVAHLLVGPPRNTMYLPVLIALYAAAGHRIGCGLATAAVGAAVFPAKGIFDGTLLAVAACGTAWLLGVERRRHAAERTELAARRLHDTLAQSTTVMLVQAEALRAGGALTEADRARLDTVLAAGRGALTLVRRTLRELHDQHDLPPDLTEVLARLRAAGLVLDHDPRLTGLARPVRDIAERIIAETATNALRHNGPGVRLHLGVEVTGDAVRITARNARSNRKPPGSGYGLTSLAEQVAAVHGTLHAAETGDGEWLVTAELPLTCPGSPVAARR
ncbi:sensor histidine kinase [Amycolatopsis taiwanensis]|uniref:histidine kinase n=1 Tax=Amycolatopsis taiwanensis TaxID=342230 RepID=A0A9W6R311_9PSEU|nr:histidine kinase [Amycolatopsis taiwanensis]GLY68328.1 histidine kinase [Amycolatopsis taiwanensis]